MSILMDTKVLSERLARSLDQSGRDDLPTADAGVVVSRRDVIQYANDHACVLLGYTRGELSGMGLQELFDPKRDPERLLRDIHRHVRESGGAVIETRWRRGDGQSIPVRLSAGLADPDGLDTCLSFIITDLSDTLNLQRELDRTRSLMEAVYGAFAHGPAVVFRLRNAEGYPADHVSPNVQELLGYSVEDFLSGRITYPAIVDERDRDRVMDGLRGDSAEAPSASREPHRVVAQDGREVWVSTFWTAVREASGGITHYLGYLLDVSRTMLMEDTLRGALSFNRQIVAGIGQGVVVYDRDFVYLEFNPFMERLTGMSRDRVVGRCAFDLFPHLLTNHVDALMRRALEGETVTSPEIRFTGQATGRSHWMVNTYSPYRDRHGEIAGVVGLIHDVTDRVEAEQAVADAAQLAKAIVQGAPIPQFIIDRDHKVTHWNTPLEEISGIKAADIIGTDEHWRAFYPLPRPCLADILVDSSFESIPTWYLGKYQRSKTVAGAYEGTDFFPHLGQDGRWLHFSAASIRDTDGRVIGAIETLQDITDQKRTEEALLTGEERYRNFVMNATEGIFRIDFTEPISVNLTYQEIATAAAERAVVGEVNAALANMYGLQPGDMKGRSVREFAPDCGIQTAELVVTPGCRIIDHEEVQHTAAGVPVNLVQSYFGHVEKGLLTRIWGVQRDVTSQKAADAALRESEARYSRIVNLASEGVVACDADFRITFVNARLAELLGYEPQELIGRDDTILLFEEDAADQVRRIACLSRGRTQQHEQRLRRRNGEALWVHFSATPVFDTQNRFTGCFGMVVDLSERKRAEEALAKSEGMLRSMLEASTVGITLAVNRRMLRVNPALCRMTGFSEQELVGQSTRVLYPDDEEFLRIGRDLYGQMERDGLRTVEARLQRKDGSPLDVILSLSPLDPNDPSAGVTATVMDITQRKRTEEALRRSEEQYSLIADNSADWIYWIKPDGTFQFTSPSCEHVTGYTPSELAEQPALLTEMIHPDDRERMRDHVEHIAEGPEEHALEYRIITKRGDTVWVSHTCAPMYGRDGQFAGRRGTNRDITDRKQAEEQMKGLARFPQENPNPILRVSMDGGMLYANPASGELLRLVGTEPGRAIPDRWRQWAADALTAGTPQEQDTAIGSSTYSLTFVPVIEGQYVNIYGRDITERKRAESALRQSELNLAAFFNTINDLLFVVDHDGRILRANGTAVRRLGHTNEELVGVDIATLAPAGMQPEISGLVTTMGTQPEAGGTTQLLTAAGTRLLVEIHVVNGQWSGAPALFVVCRDVTELMLSEEKFSQTFRLNAAPMALSTVEQGRFVDVNESFLRTLGYAPEEVIGRTSEELSLFVDPSQRGEVMRALKEQGKARDLEIDIQGKDGSRICGLFSVGLIDLQGEPHILTVMNDITERKLVQDRLRLNARRVQALLGLNQMTHATLDEITTYALEEAVAITQSEIGYLAFVSQDETILRMHSWSQAAMAQCAMVDKPIEYVVSETGLWGEAVRQRRAVITNDFAAPNSAKKGYPDGHVVVRRHMNVPVFSGDHIVLVAGVGNRADEYTEADVVQLTLLMEGMWRLIERIQVQETLANSEQKFRTLFETMQEGVALHEIIFDDQHRPVDYRIRDLNPAFERHTGIDAGSAIGRLASETYGALSEANKDVWATVVGTGQSHTCEMFVDLLARHLRVSVLCPEPGLLALVVQDFTGQKQQDATIREREEKLSSIFRSAPIGVGMVKERIITEANDELCRMTGYSREELLGQDSRVLYPTQEEYEAVGREKYRQIAELGTGTVETRWRQRGGEIKHIVLSSSPLDRANLAKGVTFTALDITARKTAEEALREKAEELDRYFTSPLDLLCITDMQGRFKRLNKEWENVLGYSVSELEGICVLDLVHPDDLASTNDVLCHRANAGEVRGFANRYRCKDGSYRWIEWRSFPRGELIYACARDITERLQAEEALAESERRFRFVGERTGQMLYDWDMTTGAIKWVGAVESITGFTPDEYQHIDIHAWEQMIHPDDRKAAMTSLDLAVQRAETFVTEYRLRKKDNEYVQVEDSGVFIRNERGEPYRMVGTMKDISERKLAQEDRERLIKELEGKNSELERFAYTVSHDLKAPLITISGFVGLLKQHAEAGAIDRMNSDIERIFNAAAKMAGLLDSLLEVSRIGRIVNPSESISVTELAGEAVEILAGRIGARQAEVQVQPDMPAVYGDRPRLVEVFQNLIDNAVKYMGDQNAPRIEIGCREQDGTTVFFVRDNGIGIPPRFHERVFNLFTQLDPTKEGSGVGLALVKRIIEYHGGKIWAESEGENRGSTFCLRLPEPSTHNEEAKGEGELDTIIDHVGRG